MYKIQPIHPGEILKTEFLDAFNVSAYRLAKEIEVPLNRITEIINAKRNISTETALLLSKYFGLSDSYWIMLQAKYDEFITKDKIFDHLASIHPINSLEKINTIAS